MATVRLIEEKEAQGRVREIFEDIKTTKKIDFIPNIWRALANHPMHLSVTWKKLKAIMHEPTQLDSLTKEMLALAVSVTNGCTY